MRVGNLSAYEQRKFQQAFDKMQLDIAKVRRSKLPRKQFQFASRKFLKRQPISNVNEKQDVEYKNDNILLNKSNETLILNELTGDYTI